jgi:hypothetical protein
LKKRKLGYLGRSADYCKWFLLPMAAVAGIAGSAIAVPVFAPRPGATFHKTAGGEQIAVPYGVLIAPIEGVNYNKSGWCKWRLVDGRGKPVQPSTAWVKCSMTGQSVGQI